MDTKMIGNKIASARKGINMSQAALAERLFISPQAVGKWERGESVPDIITINRLAEILGVDLNYFSASAQGAEGMTVFKMAGDPVEQTDEKETAPAQVPGQELLTNFSGSNLLEIDLSGVRAHKRQFNGSMLRGSNFAGADLTGSTFKASDMREANFDGANLTDCTLFAVDLTDASFNRTMMVRTELSASDTTRGKFTEVQLINARLTKTDLRKTIFEHCVFNGVDLSYSDLRGLCLDGQTFTGVQFHNSAMNNATFKGATLTNVSFQSAFALTNKYHKALKTICFDGATMDKLTYAALRGFGAELTGVTVI